MNFSEIYKALRLVVVACLAVSVGGLHAVAPGAVLSMSHIFVPIIAQGAHVAELASDCLALDQWVASDDTRLPCGVALSALKRCLVKVVVCAFVAGAVRQLATDVEVDVDLQHPVADLVTLLWAQEVLLRKGNVVR